MSVVVNKYFIIYSPKKLLPDALPKLPDESGYHVDVVSTSDALATLVEKKVPAAIFLIQVGGKDPVNILNNLRKNANADTVAIFAVNNLQDACKRMMELVKPNS